MGPATNHAQPNPNEKDSQMGSAFNEDWTVILDEELTLELVTAAKDEIKKCYIPDKAVPPSSFSESTRSSSEVCAGSDSRFKQCDQ